MSAIQMYKCGCLNTLNVTLTEFKVSTIQIYKCVYVNMWNIDRIPNIYNSNQCTNVDNNVWYINSSQVHLLKSKSNYLQNGIINTPTNHVTSHQQTPYRNKNTILCKFIFFLFFIELK